MTGAAQCGADTADEDNRDATESRTRGGEEHRRGLTRRPSNEVMGGGGGVPLDRSLRDGRPLCFSLTPAQHDGIAAIAMDMWESYIQSTRAQPRR